MSQPKTTTSGRVARETLAALAVIYVTTRRTFGPRAAALATLVTATMPQFFFISHQAITDLPLVAAITIAACCLLVAIEETSNCVRSVAVLINAVIGDVSRVGIDGSTEVITVTDTLRPAVPIVV